MSVTDAVVVTVECTPAVVGLTEMAALISGITLTKNSLLTLPGESSLSTAVHVTRVTPTGNVDPDEWSHVTAGVPSSSIATGAGYVTAAPAELVATAVMLAGLDRLRS